MSTTYSIRAHHLLCMQGFQGKGYSKAFSENFTKVLDQINQAPNSIQLKLTKNIDELCMACPHKQDDVCMKDDTANERMQAMDQATLDGIDLPEDFTGTAESLFAQANTKLTTKDDVQKICACCEWTSDCLWYQRLS
mgnify:CR=1 FL=1|jgi:uncharacterized protein